MKETLTLNFDGGSRGNPGPAGVGVVVCAEDGTELVTLGRFIGRATNNVAEYRALITGLEEAKKLGATRLHIRGDSELIIKQMRGEYRVKNADLRPLYDQAKQLVAHFEAADFQHNLRHKNTLADRLANLAMDRKSDVTEVDSTLIPSPSAAAITEHFGCSRCGCVIEVQVPSRAGTDHGPFTCRCGNRMTSQKEI